MHMKPLHTNVLIEETAHQEQKTESGIYIDTEIKTGTCLLGTVLAIGTDSTHDLTGKQVYFTPAETVVVKGSTQHLVPETNVLAVIE